MRPSAYIQMLESLRNDAGTGPMVTMQASQFATAYFPGSTTVTVEVNPTVGSFASIGYHIQPFPFVPPHVFSVEVFQAQARVVSGIVDETIIRDGFAGFLIITEQYPLVFRLTNRGARAQRFANTAWSIDVDSRDGLLFVESVIARGGVWSPVQEQALQILTAAIAGQSPPTLPVEQAQLTLRERLRSLRRE